MSSESIKAAIPNLDAFSSSDLKIEYAVRPNQTGRIVMIRQGDELLAKVDFKKLLSHIESLAAAEQKDPEMKGKKEKAYIAIRKLSNVLAAGDASLSKTEKDKLVPIYKKIQLFLNRFFGNLFVSSHDVQIKRMAETYTTPKERTTVVSIEPYSKAADHEVAEFLKDKAELKVVSGIVRKFLRNIPLTDEESLKKSSFAGYPLVKEFKDLIDVDPKQARRFLILLNNKHPELSLVIGHALNQEDRNKFRLELMIAERLIR